MRFVGDYPDSGPVVGAVSKDVGVTEAPGPLDLFSAPTRTWFGAAFAEPTPAQAGAWAAIGAGHHALVVAPTGSGKTLSAFLWSIDRLLTTPPPDDKTKRCRVLYVSPLKALAVDVERNLRSPAHRHPAHRRPPRHPRARAAGRHPVRRHQRRRPSAAGHRPARRDDHDAGVAVPDAHQPGPRVAARGRDGDHRRGARRRRHQARRPPRPHPRAPRRAARPPGAAGRAVRDGAAARGGRPVPRRRGPGRDRGSRRPRRPGTSASSSPSRT